MLTDPQGGHEQVLTIAGPLDMIFKAFSLICRKLWDFLQSLGGQQQLLRRRFLVCACLRLLLTELMR